MVQNTVKHSKTVVAKAGCVLQGGRQRKPSDGFSWDWSLEDHTLLKAFTQARISPLFFFTLSKSFHIYSIFLPLRSYRRLSLGSYRITFVTSPLLLLSSLLSICLTMHQIFMSHSKQWRENNRESDAAPTTLLASLVRKGNWQNPHRLLCNPERQEKLEDDVKRMLFPRTLVWPSNRKRLSDTTFNHILFFSHVLYTQLKVIIGRSFSHLISTKTTSTAHRGLSFKHESCSAESEWLLYFTMTIHKGLNWRTWGGYICMLKRHRSSDLLLLT